MTKIKICGLTRNCDILSVNELMPDYIGFVFWEKSRRNLTPQVAMGLKELLSPQIQAVGVFVDAAPEFVAGLLNNCVIDMAQIHGHEDENYIRTLRSLSDKPIMQAFRVQSEEDLRKAEQSTADYILLDSGTGSGKTFDWNLMRTIRRPFFLAGGLDVGNVRQGIEQFQPYAVDVSSGVETNGLKDYEKMREFVLAVRKEENV